jgi:hypothetical protein
LHHLLLQVLGRMKQAMVEHSSSASHSFLLDDDSTLPFVANDILAQMDDKVCTAGFLHCDLATVLQDTCFQCVLAVYICRWCAVCRCSSAAGFASSLLAIYRLA